MDKDQENVENNITAEEIVKVEIRNTLRPIKWGRNEKRLFYSIVGFGMANLLLNFMSLLPHT